MMSVLRLALILGLAALLGACATPNGEPHPRDPWEGYNRAMFEFNDVLDRNVAKPVAEGYRAVTPDTIQTGVSNFFSNLDDVTVFANDLLQGKFSDAARDFSRVYVNTIVGLLGFIDVASAIGLEKNNEDFGQTLAVWGVPEGPYFVLPFLGPSTLRDTAGWAGDRQTNPISYVEPEHAQWQLDLGDVLETRARLLDAEDVLQDAQFGRYELIRDAYLDRREFLIFDGNPPQEEEVDLLDELDAF